jgi:hypothetical protein
VHEHRLGLVVSGVGDGNDGCADRERDASEESIAKVARGFFYRLLVRASVRARVGSFNVKGEAALLRLGADTLRVGFGGLWAEAMIQMGDMQREGTVIGERVKHVEQAQAIRPAGDAHHHAVAGAEQIALFNELPHALSQVHQFPLLCLSES